MTTKQRAYLKGLAMTMDPIFQIGKSSMTPEFTKAIAEALEAAQIKTTILNHSTPPDAKCHKSAQLTFKHSQHLCGFSKS